MSITISVIESSKQVIFGIPEYITVQIGGVANANVFYTFDGSAPDPTGASLTTFLMEHDVGNPLNGTIFLPTDTNLLFLNILAVGSDPSDTAIFIRRYGLQSRNIGIKRPGLKTGQVSGGSGYVLATNASKTADAQIITDDGYSSGLSKAYTVTEIGYDGYAYNYDVATSGAETAFPAPVYDHIVGYTDPTLQNPDGVITTTLTPGDELNLDVRSDGNQRFIVVPDPTSPTGSKLVAAPSNYVDTDKRSTSIIDSDNKGNQFVPVETYPESPDGYTDDAGINTVTDDYNNSNQSKTTFTSGGIFNPRAAVIEIDARTDGYINGQPIKPGDRVILNRTFGSILYKETREDLSQKYYQRFSYISGGALRPIVDYNKGQVMFAYADLHDCRYIFSLAKIDPPNYDIIAKRNGKIVGYCFKWIWNKGGYF